MRTSKRIPQGMRRIAVFAAGLVTIAMLGAGQAAAADKVTVQLDYIYIRGNYAPFYLGRDKGMFRDEGIDVAEIRLGRGSADTAQRIGQGTSEIGFADLATALVVRSRGAPIVALAAVNAVSPFAVISLKAKHPLHSAKDLEGKSVAVTPALSTYYLFKAFAAANDVDLNKVQQVSATPPYEPLLLSGRVDALPGYIDAEIPELATAAGGADKLDVLLGENYGFKLFGTGIITNEKTIATKPDLLRRFMRAYVKALRYTIDHPDEAVAELMKVDPKLNPKTLRAQLQADIEKTFTNASTEKCGLGYMDPARWETTSAVLVKQKVIETAPKLDEAYTNRFLGSSCK